MSVRNYGKLSYSFTSVHFTVSYLPNRRRKKRRPTFGPDAQRETAHPLGWAVDVLTMM